MKKCPFCAEEIQDEAIKCKHCNSWLSAAPAASPGSSAPAAPAPVAPAPAPAAPAPAAPAAPAPAPVPAAPAPAFAAGPLRPAHSTATTEADQRERRVLYSGCPSWRAFLGTYALIIIGTIIVPIAMRWIFSLVGLSTLSQVLVVLISIGLGVAAFFGLGIYRKARIVRVSTSNIETEYGILSKRIDVIELWRCRDVRYRQSLVDRMLGIAHIDIFTADVTTPQLEIVGLPASRQLFEKLRDSIEIQRQHRNVVGFVQ